MRTLHATGFAAVLAATALVAPGGASAASPTTYTGMFSGEQVDYVNCTTTTPTNYATGTWSVTMHGTSAKGHFTLVYGTVTHLDYTFPGMRQAPANTEDDWLVSGRTVAGMLFVAAHDGEMTYTVEPYNYNGLSCDRLVIQGTVDRE